MHIITNYAYAMLCELVYHPLLCSVNHTLASATIIMRAVLAHSNKSQLVVSVKILHKSRRFSSSPVV